MQLHERPVVVALMLVLCVGCGQNYARADDDLVAHINLGRHDVRKHGIAKPIDIEFTEELFSSVNINRPEDLLVAIFVLPIVAGIVAGIEVGIRSIGETTVYIEPEGYPTYRQRLWWGRNTVYFPIAVAGQTVPVKILFYGNYSGSYSDAVKVRGIVRQPHVLESPPNASE